MVLVSANYTVNCVLVKAFTACSKFSYKDGNPAVTPLEYFDISLSKCMWLCLLHKDNLRQRDVHPLDDVFSKSVAANVFPDQFLLIFLQILSKFFFLFPHYEQDIVEL